MKVTWEVQQEVPAAIAILRKAYWETPTHGTFATEEMAKSIFSKAQNNNDWPIRMVKVTREIIQEYRPPNPPQ